MPLIQCFFPGHDIPSHVSVVNHHFPGWLYRPFGVIRKIITGHRCFDTRQCERFGQIYRPDSGMRVRASQHLAIQHVWQIGVSAKLCPARDFIDTVWPGRPSTHPFQGFIPGFSVRYRVIEYFLYRSGHVYSLITAAVSSTARTILS